MARVNTAGKIALGVTGAALTAGAVATGVALSKKENRMALKKKARRAAKSIRKIQGMVEQGAARERKISGLST